MNSSQFLAYAAPVIVTLLVIGMALSTRRRLDKRKAKVATDSASLEARGLGKLTAK